MLRTLLLLIIAALLCQCTPKTGATLSAEEIAMQEKAEQLAQRYIITDGHIDLPYRLTVKNFQLTREFIGIPIKSEEGDFDFERARQGGLDAPFMSIYIPASYQTKGGAKELADSLIDMVQGIIAAHPDHFTAGDSPKMVQQAFQAKKIALPMGMENGAPIGEELKNIGYFYQRGIRYITLTHSKDNQICDSSYDTTRTWNGLSPYGEQVVREMNRVGMMIDISHVSDSTFYQVMRLSKAPCIASHSSCRYFMPGFERNMSDDMIRLLAKNEGVIQINFGSTFVDAESRRISRENRRMLAAELEARGLERDSEEGKAFITQFRKTHPFRFADVETVANHIDHVVKLVGPDHVGFGSDFDGVGDSLPDGLKDVSAYPNLIYALLKRGYSEEDIEKICYKNVFRVWETVNKVKE